jgi:SAM-dependent methyltransferase
MPVDIKKRVTFLHQTGESAATNYADTFDVVWMRFVVIHVPQPLELLQAAKDCLKPADGKLFVEDCDASGYIADPPVTGVDHMTEAHIQVSKQLGADVERGRMIGSYFHALGLTEIRCQSFVPIFGRGVEILPWGGTPYDKVSQEEKFQLGIQLFDMTCRSLTARCVRAFCARPACLP